MKVFGWTNSYSFISKNTVGLFPKFHSFFRFWNTRKKELNYYWDNFKISRRVSFFFVKNKRSYIFVVISHWKSVKIVSRFVSFSQWKPNDELQLGSPKPIGADGLRFQLWTKTWHNFYLCSKIWKKNVQFGKFLQFSSKSTIKFTKEKKDSCKEPCA